MTDWTLEELTRLKSGHDRCKRLGQARRAPAATSETRIALVAFELGLTDRQLEQFYYVNRKGAKKRHFDHHAFAKSTASISIGFGMANCAAIRAGWSASKLGRAPAGMLSPRIREGMRHDRDNLQIPLQRVASRLFSNGAVFEERHARGTSGQSRDGAA